VVYEVLYLFELSIFR